MFGQDEDMPTNLHIKNTNQRNALKLTPQDKKPVLGKKTTDINHKWEDVGNYCVLAPGELVDIWVGPGRRVLIEELPT